MASTVYPLPHAVKPIGYPNKGTHAKDFNRRGGSDNWQSENAVDLPAPKGTPIYAVANGVIDNRIGSLSSKSSRMAGLRVYVNTTDNSYYYAHLSRLVVKAGQHVHAGQLIGYSGVANGVAHLHFAAKNGDPRQAFGAVQQQQPDAQSAPAEPAAAAVPADAAQIVPPSQSPPPTALGAPATGLAAPGSVDYTLTPHHEVYGLWQQAATGNQVSPDTAALMRNAQLATGT